jgi:NTE family protein
MAAHHKLNPVLALALLTLALPALAGDRSAPQPQPERPRIGLVLSGGGARGAAHVGVLKVLEEYRIPVDYVAGTSMGSIVGGFYAAGMSPEELEQVLSHTDWIDLFQDKPDRGRRYFRRKEDDADLLIAPTLHLKKGRPRFPLGLIHGQKLENMLKLHEERTTNEQDFNRFPIPFRAVAADLDTGEAVVIDRGSLATALRASMSIPGVFPPVPAEGRLLIDGGVAANLPVHVAQKMGADIIIAVDISTPLKRDHDPESYASVFARLSGFLISDNVAREKALLGDGDILIVPDLGDITAAHFNRADDAVLLGEVAAREAQDQLSRLALSEEAFADYLAQRRRMPPSTPTIDDVRLENAGPLQDKVVKAQIRQQPGKTFDADKLLADLTDLYGLGYSEPITFDLLRRQEQTDLLVKVRPRRIGLDTLRFGLDLENDFQGGASFTLKTRYQKLALNRSGAEWRNDLELGKQTGLRTEFYQPFDRRLRYFVAPSLFYEQDNRTVTVDGQAVTDMRITRWGGRVNLGRNLARWGQLRLGLVRGVQDPDVRVGLPIPDLEPINVAGADLTLDFDTLDSPTWPTRGGLGFLQLAETDEVLGGETDTSNLGLEANWAFSFGRNSLVPGVELGLDLGSGGEAIHGFELGGRLRLSGYSPGELFGREGLVGRVVFYRQLNRRVMRLVQPGWYIGASAEAGNAYFEEDPITWDSLLLGGSIFVGADTPLGPIVLGVGFAEPDRSRVFLSIGRSLLQR